LTESVKQTISTWVVTTTLQIRIYHCQWSWHDTDSNLSSLQQSVRQSILWTRIDFQDFHRHETISESVNPSLGNILPFIKEIPWIVNLVNLNLNLDYEGLPGQQTVLAPDTCLSFPSEGLNQGLSDSMHATRGRGWGQSFYSTRV